MKSANQASGFQQLLALAQLASTDECQSHFSATFTTGPASILPQLAFDKEAIDVTKSDASRQSQHQIFTFANEQGPIEVQSCV